MRGKMGKLPRRTFDEALLRWLKGDAATLKDTSIKNKARIVLPHLKGVWLDQVPDATENMKQKFIAEKLKPATINRRLAIVRRVLNLSYDWGWTETKLGQRIKLLRENNERHIFLTYEDVSRLAKAAGKAEPMIWQLAYTGLRLSELMRLTADNVIGEVIVLQSNTKSGKPRTVPIHPEIVNHPIPVQITRSEFRRLFEAARAKIGRPELHTHDLRHTFASWLIKGGVGLTVVRDVLGHAHLGVTSRYVHLEDAQIRQAMGKIGSKKKARKTRLKTLLQ
jgi:integrase